MAVHKVGAGSILIAEPFLGQKPFHRSVIFLTEHRLDGSVGFILNKKIDMRVEDLLPDFPDFDAPVHYGGPVDTDTIHYIHTVGNILDNSTLIKDGIYWGGDFEKLKFLISSQLIKPENIKFYIGYSGWSEGQLQEELGDGTWMIDEMYANYAFKDEESTLWSRVLDNKGDHYTVIAQIPDFISQN